MLSLRDKKTIFYLFIFVIITLLLILIISSFINQPEEENNQIVEDIIDDRISPLTNQAVFLEIHRIRKNGIIDQMMNAGSSILNKVLNPEDMKIDSKQDRNKLRLFSALEGMRPGFGWDENPQFSYIVTLDGSTYRKNQPYRCWDTGYINEHIFKNVTDENKTTNVKITIFEEEKTKIFSKDIVDQEMETISLTYDFKNATWTGDDIFNDSDGYGHYLGSNYEIWFTLRQTSSDMDDIPWWVETNILHTDPLVDDSLLDPDGDGIPTEWEWKWGYDPFTWDNHSFLDPDHDGLQNIEEYQMEEWLANPYQQEIYIEVDYMDDTPKKIFNRHGYDGWKHEFYQESQQMIIERFSEHGISVHIDDGRMNEGGNILPLDMESEEPTQIGNIISTFYDNNFPDERKGVFRYMVIAYYGGWCHPQDSNHYYDCICLYHNQKDVRGHIGFPTNQRTIRIAQAVEALHELGHTLNMHKGTYGGVDFFYTGEDSPWWEYVSVMNYEYYWLRYFDYGTGVSGEYNRNDWTDRIDVSAFQIPDMYMEGIQ